MAALDTLARLQRHALDQERRELQGLIAEIAEREQRIAGLRAAMAKERALPSQAPADGGLLAVYLQEARRRERVLADELQALERDRAARIERLGALRSELKRWEILLERQARRAEAEALRRQQRAIDDLVAARRGRSSAALKIRGRG